MTKFKKQLPVYAFTNSNHAHKKVWSVKFSNILSVFDRVFISSDIGKRKPEPEAFNYVAKSIGVKPHEVLFYDDSMENILGAKKTGMHTVHVKSIVDIQASFDLLMR